MCVPCGMKLPHPKKCPICRKVITRRSGAVLSQLPDASQLQFLDATLLSLEGAPPREEGEIAEECNADELRRRAGALQALCLASPATNLREVSLQRPPTSTPAQKQRLLRHATEEERFAAANYAGSAKLNGGSIELEERAA